MLTVTTLWYWLKLNFSEEIKILYLEMAQVIFQTPHLDIFFFPHRHFFKFPHECIKTNQKDRMNEHTLRNCVIKSLGHNVTKSKNNQMRSHEIIYTNKQHHSKALQGQWKLKFSQEDMTQPFPVTVEKMLQSSFMKNKSLQSPKSSF